MFLSHQPPPPINFAHLHLPPIYILPTRLTKEELGNYRSKLLLCQCTLADIATDAAFFIGDIRTVKRAELELKKKDVIVVPEGGQAPPGRTLKSIRLVNIQWLIESLKKAEAQNPEDHIILVGQAYRNIFTPKTPEKTLQPTETPNQKRSRDIMERARQDAKRLPGSPVWHRKKKRLRTGEQNENDDLLSITKSSDKPRLRRSTSSFEAQPRTHLPDWVTKKNTYSCCRSTLSTSPNQDFLDQLKQIYISRYITQDEVGELAYSSAMAAIKAYPYRLDTATELGHIPGCDGKMADLYRQWKQSSDDPGKRFLPPVKELESRTSFLVLKDLVKIHGFGPETAKKYYFNHGVRTIKDLYKFHWESLSRVQQVGVNCYKAFIQHIPRPEIEQIAATVKKYAEGLCSGIEYVIAGGYRRGKEDSHDVDILLSHRDTNAIGPNFLARLITVLEEHELVKYTLSAAIGGETIQTDDPNLPEKATIDRLDKVLLVWKGSSSVLRRVDIIIVPTICVGTALLGWTGSTVFERDLRLYCEKEKEWKFNNEGVWSGVTRVHGTYGWKQEESWEDAEKRVMEVIQIGYRPPHERCTG